MRLIARLVVLGIVLFSYSAPPFAALAATDARTSVQHDAAQRELEGRLMKLAESLAQPALNARVDRVWHAIPGLAGLSLNVPESLRETNRVHDEQIHLIWKQMPPTTPLQTLPPEPIYRGPDAEKAVSFMFNVSWGEEYVPAILDTLAKYHVKATFFLDGAWVKKHPELARKIAQGGHCIGSHGTGHPDFRRLDSSSLERQVVQTNHTIHQAVGKPIDLIAPPAGSYDSRLVKIAHRHHVYTILWTVDTIDWRRPPASQIVQRATQPLPNGSLILMHPTAPTALALPIVITSLQGRGYSFKTVDDVVHERRLILPPSTLSKRP